MAHYKKLGLIVVSPPFPAESVGAEDYGELGEAFLVDLLERLKKLKNIVGAVFSQGALASGVRPFVPKSYDTKIQSETNVARRTAAALEVLLDGPNRGVVVIDSLCPDLPVQYIKRAYVKLKNKDVVVGPTPDGRLYLFGLKTPLAGLFPGFDWTAPGALAEITGRAEAYGFTLSVLPMWYRADSVESLRLLQALIQAKHLEKGGGVFTCAEVVERVLKRLP